jgi:hypothetical protein
MGIEYRFDSYYGRDIPYRMSREDFEASDKCSENLLAYIRQMGFDHIQFLAYATTNFVLIPGMNIALSSSGGDKKVWCRMVDNANNIYNPLREEDGFHKDHWYHPYKIEYTPVDFKGCIKHMYFSDLANMIKRGHIELREV